MKIVAVCQARMGSTRLPGKVLKPLGSQVTLDWVAQAAYRAPGVDEVVIATSTNPENDDIVDWARCAFSRWPVIRGSEDDVLDRYRQVVEETKADAIVRLTGDCPMLDSRVIGEVIALYKSGKYDYATNIDPPTWPDGLDTEVISARAIIQAAESATRTTDRDTATRYIARNRHKFPAATLNCPLPGLHKERWVLDSPEDYEFLKAVVAHFPSDWHPNYLDILDLLNKEPQLRQINAKYARNERFFDAIAHEPPVERQVVRSQIAFQRATRVIPLGAQTFSKSYVQYPIGTSPLYMTHGDGGYAFDVDGNDYVDLVSALLPNVLGYRDPDVDFAIRAQLNSGISMSLASELEVSLAEKLCKSIPCAEMVRYGKNGADVTAAAVRLSRAVTGRNKIMLIKNGYHGWHDWSMASTERNLGIPSVVKGLTLRSSGDLNKIRDDFNRLKGRSKSENIAAVIIEPEGRTPEYLAHLKKIAEEFGAILVFDEVITGFRWHIGGYQKHVKVTPHLATFGKAMANGMPLSAIVGRKDLMRRFAPPENIFYSGTFFGETLSLAASIATIEKIARENVIQKLWKVGGELKIMVQELIAMHKLDHVVYLSGDAPRVHIGFHGANGLDANQVRTAWIKAMLADGILIISSHNVCFAHGEPEQRRIVTAYDRAFHKLNKVLADGKIQKGPALQAASVRS